MGVNKLIPLLVLLLVGCKYEITGHQVRQANEFCKDKTGIHTLVAMEIIKLEVVCNNGKRINIEDIFDDN